MKEIGYNSVSSKSSLSHFQIFAIDVCKNCALLLRNEQTDCLKWLLNFKLLTGYDSILQKGVQICTPSMIVAKA